MKICFLAPTIYPYYEKNGYGGAELQMLRWSNALTKVGHRVNIITNDYGQPEKQVFDAVTVWNKILRFRGWRCVFFLLDSIRIARFIAKLNPDFCIIKVPKNALFTACLSKLWNRNIHVINFFALDSNSGPKFPIKHLPYRISIKFSDGAIFQTEFQRKTAFLYEKKKCVVIPNIFEPPQKHGEGCEKKYDFLWIGQFDSAKNPETLYRLAKELPQYKFAFVTKKSSATYCHNLQRRIKSLRNVDALGQIPFEKMQGLFDRSRCYLNTSRIEGFPNTFLQSFYSRSPVLSYMVDPDDILKKHRLGFVFDKNYETLVKNAVLLMENDELRKKMGENGYLYLQRNHLAELLVSRMNRYLESFSEK